MYASTNKCASGVRGATKKQCSSVHPQFFPPKKGEKNRKEPNRPEYHQYLSKGWLWVKYRWLWPTLCKIQATLADFCRVRMTQADSGWFRVTFGDSGWLWKTLSKIWMNTGNFGWTWPTLGKIRVTLSNSVWNTGNFGLLCVIQADSGWCWAILGDYGWLRPPLGKIQWIQATLADSG